MLSFQLNRILLKYAEIPWLSTWTTFLIEDDNNGKKSFIYILKKYTLLVHGQLIINNCYDCLMIFKLTRIRKNSPNQGQVGSFEPQCLHVFSEILLAN